MINSVEPLEQMSTSQRPTKEERALLKAEKAAQQQKDLEVNLAAATAELPWTILSLIGKARELNVEASLFSDTFGVVDESDPSCPLRLSLQISTSLGNTGVEFTRQGPQSQQELNSLESDLWDAKEFLIEVQRLKDEEKRVRERKAELLASLSQDDLEILGLAPKPTTSRW
jgi:hypothetical protein